MVDYDEMAVHYARHRHVQAEVLQSLLAVGKLNPASKVLEIGCGTGNYIIEAERALGCSCWAIDPSSEMLRRAASRSNHVNFKPGKAEKLDFPDEFFDFAFSVDVIHHVGEVHAYFLEARRVLRAGATLCTVTESEWMIRNRRPLSNYFPETVNEELRRYPAIDVLREEMRACGFGHIAEKVVEAPYRLTDISPYRNKVFSALRTISTDAFDRGIERMESDLRAGSIPCVSRYLLLWGRR